MRSESHDRANDPARVAKRRCVPASIGHPEAAGVARLRQWSVLATRNDDGRLVHLAMDLPNGNESRTRVTNPIVRIEGGQILTESGSIYSVVGPPEAPMERARQSSRCAALLGEDRNRCHSTIWHPNGSDEATR